MLGVKHNSLINPNIRTIDEIIKDKYISKEAKDNIIKKNLLAKGLNQKKGTERLSNDNVKEEKNE